MKNINQRLILPCKRDAFVGTIYLIGQKDIQHLRGLISHEVIASVFLAFGKQLLKHSGFLLQFMVAQLNRVISWRP